jgi:hypothetical protein
MKKVIVMLAIAMLSSNAYATAVVVDNVKGFNKTKNVNLTAENNGTSAPTTWSLISAHGQGDKEFWTSSAFGGLASKTVVPGTSNGTAVPTGVPATPTDSTVAGGYTTM